MPTTVTRPANPGNAQPRAAPIRAPGVAPPTDARWSLAHYVVRQRRFTLGRQYHILSGDGHAVAYAKQRWFRLKEAFNFFTDASKREVAFTVKATKVFDFKANMEVRDGAGNLLGTIRRKGWASIVADHWQVVDPAGNLVGELFEPEGRGLARRMLSRLIPYRADVRGPWGEIAAIQARFQIWGDTYDVRIHKPALDARVLLGLLVAIDALQEERGSIMPNLFGGT